MAKTFTITKPQNIIQIECLENSISVGIVYIPAKVELQSEHRTNFISKVESTIGAVLTEEEKTNLDTAISSVDMSDWL